MHDRLSDWMALLEQAYPAADAESWDNVGLQVGDPSDEVTAVLVCLDVTAETLEEAAQSGASLVLAHHPLFFRPLERLTPDSAAGLLALRAARAGVAVAAAHTNFDVASDGTTAPVMRVLGIEGARPLRPTTTEASDVKLVVFVPMASTGDVLAAAFAAGAGRIGEYDECSFRVSGTGTFRPSAAANPVVGEREQRTAVSEDRVEIVVDRRDLPGVIDAVIAAHPYEEVAFDVYPLVSTPSADTGGKGLGAVGELAAPAPLRDVAAALRVGLPARHLRVAGDPDRMIRRVAACGGAGDSLIGAAVAQGADVYVTGDLRHHVTLDAMTMGMALIDAGHYATEAAALPALISRLGNAARERGLSARLLASTRSTEPWVDGEEKTEP